MVGCDVGGGIVRKVGSRNVGEMRCGVVGSEVDGEVDCGMVGPRVVIDTLGKVDGSEVVGGADGETVGSEVVNEAVGGLVGAVVGSEVSSMSSSGDLLPDWLRHVSRSIWLSSSICMNSSGDGGSSVSCCLSKALSAWGSVKA